MKRSDLKAGDIFDWKGVTLRAVDHKGEYKSDRNGTDLAPNSKPYYTVVGSMYPDDEVANVMRIRTIKSGRTVGRIVRSFVKG